MLLEELVPVVSPLVFLSLFLFLFLDKFLPFIFFSPPPQPPPPSFCLPPLFYSFSPCSYHHSCLTLFQSLKDMLSYFIGFLPFLSWNFDCLGLRVLFRLFYVHSMQQRLDKNPLINAEVKIFTLLVHSRSFPWLPTSSGGHTMITRAPCLR